jgi:ribonuclease Z
MARMILLGVGTGLPDADRENTHMVWDGPGGPLLIDAGGSSYQRLLKAGVDPQGLAGVLLTHSHCDHINGLPVLLFSMALGGRKEPLPIYGLAPTLAIVRAVLDAFQLDGLHPPLEWRGAKGWSLARGGSCAPRSQRTAGPAWPCASRVRLGRRWPTRPTPSPAMRCVSWRRGRPR